MVQYTSSLPKLNWQLITNSSEEILGYNVQKAETVYEGKKYYAWFSTEIPLNNGPFVLKSRLFLRCILLQNNHNPACINIFNNCTTL